MLSRKCQQALLGLADVKACSVYSTTLNKKVGAFWKPFSLSLQLIALTKQSTTTYFISDLMANLKTVSFYLC